MKATFETDMAFITFNETEQNEGLQWSLDEYLHEIFGMDCYTFQDRLVVPADNEKEYASVLEKVLQGIGFLQFQ